MDDFNRENFDRALGAFSGVALGDAMGMPSQTMPRPVIAATYGFIQDLVAATADQKVSGGLAAGTITDDTEQSILLAQHLIARDGVIDDEVWARTLLDWERDTHARGVNDLLGPSTKRAIEALLRGVPVTETGRTGTTNGAAMRIVPVAIMVQPEPLPQFLTAVESSCRLTHNTAEAISSAAAVAMVVSRGVDGATFEETLPFALAAAQAAGLRGANGPSLDVATAIERALHLAAGKSGWAAAQAVADRIGTSVKAVEAVPMAFAVVRLAGGDPWIAAQLAANIGDDTDTIGAIACGMAAACRGYAALPVAQMRCVERVNHLDLASLVKPLLALRARR